MNLLKVAALLALAAVPLLLISKKDNGITQAGHEVESDEIFDLELRAE